MQLPDTIKGPGGLHLPLPQSIVPDVIENTPRGERSYDVFSRLLKERIIFLGSGINDMVSNVVIAQLLFLEHEDPERDIWLYINSPGGSVMSGLAIYDTMQFIQAPVATMCMGMAASMATVLLCAGRKGKRFALPNSTIHQHPALTGGMEGYAPDIEIQARFLIENNQRLRRIMAKHTGKPLEEIARDFDRDRFMTAQEAKDYGFIDEVVAVQPPGGLAK
ncbi:MAG: ATP-dependent Clp protease proteolytic subunit [Chloroflexota bacterium]